ncbi:hypothetical protein B5M09_006635 [Aphanomyces astaci]|uniref:FYVE-type domain-containing protein n=1 Tax=Aphanomyces astaci TaxID=112090 RepID=A0A425D7P9_APHAT|nr:hypothetical protein B5M09_006635 [Aphanomyces astaci]
MSQQASAFSPFVGAKLHTGNKPAVLSTDGLKPPPTVGDDLDRRPSTQVLAPELAALRAHGRRAAENLIRLNASTQWHSVQRTVPDEHHPMDSTADKALELVQTAEDGFCSIRGTAAVYASFDEVMQVLSVKHPRRVRSMYSHFFGKMSSEGRTPVSSCVYYQPAEDNAAPNQVLSVETVQVRPHWSSINPTMTTTHLRDKHEYAILRFVAPDDYAGVCVWDDVQASFISSTALKTAADGRPALPASTYFAMQNLVTSTLRGMHAAVVDLRLHAPMVLPKEVMGDGPRCVRCSKAFTFYRYKHHCRHCGDVVCTHCSSSVGVIDDDDSFGSQPPSESQEPSGGATTLPRGGMRRASLKRHSSGTSSIGRPPAPHAPSTSSPVVTSPTMFDGDNTPLPSPYQFRGASRLNTAPPPPFQGGPSGSSSSRHLPGSKTPSQPYQQHHGGRSPFVSSTTSYDGNSSSSSSTPPPHPSPWSPTGTPSVVESPKFRADQFDNFVDASAVKNSARHRHRSSARGKKAAAAAHEPIPEPSVVQNEDEKAPDVVTESTLLSYPLTFKDGNAWPDPPTTPHEAWRLQKTKTLDLLRPHPETHTSVLSCDTVVFCFNVLIRYVKMACKTMQCHVGALTIVGGSKGLLIAKVGVAADSIPRHILFESHVLMSTEPLVVLDCHNDLRFMTNPLVCQGDIGIRFYVGVPLITSDGCIVGALSVVDTRPRTKVRQLDLHTLVLTARTLMRRFEDLTTAAALHSGQSSDEKKSRPVSWQQAAVSDVD